MTSITYGYHDGYMCDMDNAAYWGAAHDSADPLAAVTIASNGDVIRITGTANSAVNDEYVYYQYDIPAPSQFTIAAHPKYLLRYRTSKSATSGNGLGAKIIVLATGGDETILGLSAPEYSDIWKTVAGTFTTTGTVTGIQIWADDYPNDVDDGPHWVEYDFIMLHQGTFTFPNAGHGVRIRHPPRNAVVSIPGRSGDLSQELGSESTVAEIRCDLDVDGETEDWKRPQGVLDKGLLGDTVNGQVFKDIWHNMKTEPWQWLDTGQDQFKAFLDSDVVFELEGESHRVDLIFREFCLISKESETYVERLGLNL